MVTRNGLMRIFWPSDAPAEQSPGVLVGFRNSELDVFVVAILQGVELRHVENGLLTGTLLRHSTHDVNQLLKQCRHSSLRVLGCVNPQAPSKSFDPRLLTTYTDASTRFPRLYCPADADLTLQVIMYERPHSTQMQYLSLAPMSLALCDKMDTGQWDAAFEGAGREGQTAREQKDKLVDKLKLHTVIVHTATHQDVSLPTIVDQINCSYELDALLQKNIGVIGRRLKRALSVGERMTVSANSLWNYVIFLLNQVWIVCCPVAAQVVIIGALLYCSASEMVLRVLDWRPGSSDSPALKDVSATAQQVDIRLQQSCYWPVQYLTLQYIRFYNSLWLVANDVIIGIALGSYLIENYVFVAAQVDTILSVWSIEGLRRMISWLMEWPGGLKLNTELAEFMGDLFLWVIDHWAGCMAVLRPHLPDIIYLIGCSSFAGATMSISLFSDLMSLFTLHIYAFYVTSARIFHWQLSIIISLFHLFRGRKRNVLRNRIDSCDYELDQLLLGTILFTLLVFLLPTVFVFYLTFATARVAVISLKGGLEIGLACLNHFPLFAAMLRLKDSRRLPGGIRFELQDVRGTGLLQDASLSAPTSYVVLKSIPLSLRAMFDSYFELGNVIRKHYFSPGVFLHLVSGRFVPPLHRRSLYSLQYSMLPAKRLGITEIWKQLSERNKDDVGARLRDGNGFPSSSARRGIPNGGGRKWSK